MRVYFNDLTLSDNAQADTTFIPEFVKVWKGFKARLNCGKLIADDDGMAGLYCILSLLPHCKVKEGEDYLRYSLLLNSSANRNSSYSFIH